MALATLSKPALEALLEFHVDAVSQIQQRLRDISGSASSKEELNDDVNVQASSCLLDLPLQIEYADLAKLFPTDSSPSTPRATGRAPDFISGPPPMRPASSPPFGGTWARMDVPSSPTPLPGSAAPSRKRRHVDLGLDDDDDVDVFLEQPSEPVVDDRPPPRQPARARRLERRWSSPAQARRPELPFPFVPGWPRGAVRTPRRRKLRSGDKENNQEHAYA
ncbi:hypothetical protein HMN09_00344900 [Mycena chlorophos]|uniref:Uncharacterized protein n=1 Tax=Mycena chlorophos TaxID=658473 RepID=A0A8H6WIP5_MYCCL|nr:hypothetical protein HMN09_00344900 [Mycena chlorophos]